MFFSLDPANLVQFLGPYFFQRYIGMNPDGPKQLHEAGLYPGAVAVLLTIWVVMRLLRREPVPAKGLAVGALILLVLGTVLALGKYGGLYYLVSSLPVISGFRSPCRHIVLAHLAMAVLSGIALGGLAQAARNREALAWRRSWPLLLPAVAAWLLATYLSLGLLHKVPLLPSIVPFLVSQHELWITPLVVSFATLLLLIAVRGHAWALIALLIFAAADQGMYALRYPATEPPMTLSDYQSSIPVPPENDGHRAYVMVDNLLVARGVDNCVGYVSDGILDQTLHYSQDNPSALRLAGVRWADARWPKLGQKPEWLEIREPLPYVRLLTRTQVSSDPDKDAAAIDISSVALTTDPLALPPAAPGNVSLTTKRPGEIAVRVENATRQLLTVAESWHRGWKVRVDGVDAPLLRVNGDFMGCVLEPRTHEVQFQFQPFSLALGKILSLIGVAVLAAGCWAIRSISDAP
jgi:hypothetical protein